MDTQIISRKDAKALGLTRYFTGEPCSRGHISERGIGGGCCVCSNEKSRIEYAANPFARREAAKLRQAKNPARNRANSKAWRDANPDRARALVRNWLSSNPLKVAAHAAKRRARQLRATPPWLTPEHFAQIEMIYAEARRLTEETGVPHHVDHIVPLKGGLVCGLHVSWNLRAIPANDNIRKGNRYNG